MSPELTSHLAQWIYYVHLQGNERHLRFCLPRWHLGQEYLSTSGRLIGLIKQTRQPEGEVLALDHNAMYSYLVLPWAPVRSTATHGFTEENILVQGRIPFIGSKVRLSHHVFECKLGGQWIFFFFFHVQERERGSPQLLVEFRQFDC